MSYTTYVVLYTLSFVYISSYVLYIAGLTYAVYPPESLPGRTSFLNKCGEKLSLIRECIFSDHHEAEALYFMSGILVMIINVKLSLGFAS